jgi:hypothetical protein
VQRRTLRQCAAICGIGRRRIRAGMAWTDLSPRKGGHLDSLNVKRGAPRPRARTMLCLNHNLHREDSIITNPPPLPYIRHSFSSVLASWPPTYESDRQTDITTFFDSRSQLYPYTETLPRKCSGNYWIMPTHKTTAVFHRLCATVASDWQERISIG